MWDINTEIYRDVQDYIVAIRSVAPIRFVVVNASEHLAAAVSVTLTVDADDDLILLDELPPIPSETSAGSLFTSSPVMPDVTFERRGSSWAIELEFGNVKPGASRPTRTPLLMGIVKQAR